MIRGDVELTVLKYVRKCLIKKYIASSFSFEYTVLHLNQFELSGKIGDRAPLVLIKLL